jgi:hydantoinase/carbamoylase family amidase
MHDLFVKLGAQEGFTHFSDEVGNTYVCNSDRARGYHLIGSHLDSVIEGGRYDGVAGILAGLMVMKWIKEDGLNIPVRVGAFRCEESSNFGRATIGSGLITREATKHDIADVSGKDGRRLADIFEERGYNFAPSRIDGMLDYLEVHIEQGKVLEEFGEDVGIVQTIAGPRRFSIHILGTAEHSGATPMGMRTDALCAAAEIILEVEQIARDESIYQSVATVGVIRNTPNAMNVVPGEVEMGLDIRGVDISSLDRIESRVRTACKRICGKRKVTYYRQKTSDIPPINMDGELQKKLLDAARKLKISARSMISGAGHDAMSFAPICPTAMVFIPCDRGISHNKNEFTTIDSICDGARVIYEYLKREASRK